MLVSLEVLRNVLENHVCHSHGNLIIAHNRSGHLRVMEKRTQIGSPLLSQAIQQAKEMLLLSTTLLARHLIRQCLLL